MWVLFPQVVAGFSSMWLEARADVHIMIKELMPIAMGVAMWGSQWRNGTVKCKYDNAVVVVILC